MSSTTVRDRSEIVFALPNADITVCIRRGVLVIEGCNLRIMPVAQNVVNIKAGVTESIRSTRCDEAGI